MRHILLAAPGHFDRDALHRHSELNGLQGVGVFQAEAKTSSDHLRVDMDFVFREHGELCRMSLDKTRNLRSRPDVEAIAGVENDRVQWFHRRMCKIGDSI